MYEADFRRHRSSLAVLAAILSLMVGCGKPSVTAIDKQRLSRAWAYYIYAKADLDLSRLDLITRYKLCNSDADARRWVVGGLRAPAVLDAKSFSLGLSPKSISAKWESHFVENEKKSFSESMIAIFGEAAATWNPHERLWHLGPQYAADYEWARQQDKMSLPIEFYQDPFPKVSSTSL